MLIDEACVIQELNGAAIEMLGYPEEALIGHKLSSFSKSECKDEVDAYLELCRANKTNSLKIKAFYFGNNEDDFSTLELDFNHFFKDSDDGLTYSIGLLYDITDKVELEEEIEYHKKSKKSIQKNSSCGFELLNRILFKHQSSLVAYISNLAHLSYLGNHSTIFNHRIGSR